MNPPTNLATNTARVARIISLILASAISCAIGFFLIRAIPTPYPVVTPAARSSGAPVTTTPTPIAIDPGGHARLTALPDLRPTVKNPMLILRITVTDEQTHQPVTAHISVDNQSIHATSAEITVAANAPHTITVTAENYQPWETRLETNLHHHKTMDLPILLHPTQDTG